MVEPGDDATDGAEATTTPLDVSQIRDQLPDDLNATGYVGPYVFPNNNRRRIPGYIYLGIATGLVVIWLAFGESTLVNNGLIGAAVLLAAVGVYQLVSGWDLDIDEQDALVAATGAVGFPVGHAAAQMGWRGYRSRPTWRILLYSADEPPAKRGLVFVDGVDGQVLDQLIEDNPEDWSKLLEDEPGAAARQPESPN